MALVEGDVWLGDGPKQPASAEAYARTETFERYGQLPTYLFDEASDAFRDNWQGPVPGETSDYRDVFSLLRSQDVALYLGGSRPALVAGDPAVVTARVRLNIEPAETFDRRFAQRVAPVAPQILRVNLSGEQIVSEDEDFPELNQTTEQWKATVSDLVISVFGGPLETAIPDLFARGYPLYYRVEPAEDQQRAKRQRLGPQYLSGRRKEYRISFRLDNVSYRALENLVMAAVPAYRAASIDVNLLDRLSFYFRLDVEHTNAANDDPRTTELFVPGTLVQQLGGFEAWIDASRVRVGEGNALTFAVKREDLAFPTRADIAAANVDNIVNYFQGRQLTAAEENARLARFADNYFSPNGTWVPSERRGSLYIGEEDYRAFFEDLAAVSGIQGFDAGARWEAIRDAIPGLPDRRPLDDAEERFVTRIRIHLSAKPRVKSGGYSATSHWTTVIADVVEHDATTNLPTGTGVLAGYPGGSNAVAADGDASIAALGLLVLATVEQGRNDAVLAAAEMGGTFLAVSSIDSVRYAFLLRKLREVLLLPADQQQQPFRLWVEGFSRPVPNPVRRDNEWLEAALRRDIAEAGRIVHTPLDAQVNARRSKLQYFRTGSATGDPVLFSGLGNIQTYRNADDHKALVQAAAAKLGLLRVVQSLASSSVQEPIELEIDDQTAAQYELQWLVRTWSLDDVRSQAGPNARGLHAWVVFYPYDQSASGPPSVLFSRYYSRADLRDALVEAPSGGGSHLVLVLPPYRLRGTGRGGRFLPEQTGKYVGLVLDNLPPDYVLDPGRAAHEPTSVHATLTVRSQCARTGRWFTDLPATNPLFQVTWGDAFTENPAFPRAFSWSQLYNDALKPRNHPDYTFEGLLERSGQRGSYLDNVYGVPPLERVRADIRRLTDTIRGSPRDFDAVRELIQKIRAEYVPGILIGRAQAQYDGSDPRITNDLWDEVDDDRRDVDSELSSEQSDVADKIRNNPGITDHDILDEVTDLLGKVEALEDVTDEISKLEESGATTLEHLSVAEAAWRRFLGRIFDESWHDNILEYVERRKLWLKGATPAGLGSGSFFVQLFLAWQITQQTLRLAEAHALLAPDRNRVEILTGLERDRGQLQADADFVERLIGRYAFFVREKIAAQVRAHAGNNTLVAFAPRATRDDSIYGSRRQGTSLDGLLTFSVTKPRLGFHERRTRGQLVRILPLLAMSPVDIMHDEIWEERGRGDYPERALRPFGIESNGGRPDPLLPQRNADVFFLGRARDSLSAGRAFFCNERLFDDRAEAYRSRAVDHSGVVSFDRAGVGVRPSDKFSLLNDYRKKLTATQGEWLGQHSSANNQVDRYDVVNGIVGSARNPELCGVSLQDLHEEIVEEQRLLRVATAAYAQNRAPANLNVLLDHFDRVFRLESLYNVLQEALPGVLPQTALRQRFERRTRQRLPRYTTTPELLDEYDNQLASFDGDEDGIYSRVMGSSRKARRNTYVNVLARLVQEDIGLDEDAVRDLVVDIKGEL